MKEQIEKILKVSKNLQAICNDHDSNMEVNNVIEFLNQVPEEQLYKLRDKFNRPNAEKINKIRLLVVNFLIEKRNITFDDIEVIKFDVDKQNEKNILQAWKSYFSLFLPFIYQDKVYNVLVDITNDLITKLELNDTVKSKIVDFDGANNFGSDRAWIALYNKNQANQGSSLQLFISFSGDTIRYGIYQHASESWLIEHEKNIVDFNYDEMISELEKDKERIIEDNVSIKCWKFSPGEDAVFWDEMERSGVAAIGWGNRSFTGKSKNEIKKLLPGFSGRSVGIVKAFMDINVGDFIFAFKGRKEIVGYGVVTKSGLYSDSEVIHDSDYHNYHEVKWNKVSQRSLLKNFVAIYAVANISDRYHELNSLLNFDGDRNSSSISNESTEIKIIQPLNQILYGPPGTGKTFNTINTAVAIANPSFDLNVSRKDIKAEFDRLTNDGQIVFTTFHQSMSYEDFIEGIKPETIEDRVVYEIKEGIFKKICSAALTPNQLDLNDAYEQLKKDLSSNEIISINTPTGKEFSVSLNSNDNLTLHTGPNKEKQGSLTLENIQKQINGESKFIGWEGYFRGVINYLENHYNYSSTTLGQSKNFVIIIDEINRGNVSQIFGELITLIEDDKRLGKAEALEVTLPYSKETFGVPSNLYIIGTMNTADRSVEALDAALRRRFSFQEMPPIPNLIAREGSAENGYLDQIYLPDLLKKINLRIEKLLDRDHQIGHSYFMPVSNLDDLRYAFQNKIIPLLQEYFFGDYGKLGLVLGNHFFENNSDIDSIKFANFNGYDSADFEERVVYKIRNILLKRDDQYVMHDDEFKEAINSILV